MIKDYFERIDTEAKAYWLGFLYADGCVSQDLKSVVLELSSVDEDHVYKFANAIGSNHKVSAHGKNKNFTRIAVSCKQMGIDLYNHGCVPRKSMILEFPKDNIVPEGLIYHFIRGYFDGDGCLSHSSGMRKRNDRNGNKLYPYDKWFLKFVGTKSMLNGIAHYMDMSNKLYRPTDNKNHYSLKCGGKILVKNKMDKIYENATIYLDRKYNKYIELCNNCA